MTATMRRRTSTDIAVVGWAQTPMVRRTELTEAQLLIEVITAALTPLGLTRADVDFTCLGSCDYITGEALIAAGLADERAMAEVAVRSRGRGTVAELLAGDYVRAPLRRHDLPPITDGATAMVLAIGARARQLVERPAYITGFDHRTECHNPAFRRLDDAPSVRIAAHEAGVGDAPLEVAELQASFTHEELLLRHVLGLGDEVQVNPSGGPLRANPIMASGLSRIGFAAEHIFAGGTRALGHATSGPCLQQNLICVLEGRS